MTREEKIQQAHEYNLDAAYREIEMREAMGEDMSTAYVDEKTYAVVKAPAADTSYENAAHAAFYSQLYAE